MTETAFSTLKLHADLLNNLVSLGYKNMTPIQAQSLPFILSGKDVIAQGKTGSGKTAAFSLGLLEKLNVKHFRIQSLVLCPTRELADQVAKEIRRFARSIHNIKVLTLCGGAPFGPQIGSLEHGAHIIVGTPGRVEEHIRKGTLNLENLVTFVLDEADRMLDMGFEPALDAIVAKMPQKRQTLLFSATYPEQIQSIAARYMTKPAIVEASEKHNNSSIQQYKFKLENKIERITALRLLLLHYHPESALVFCNTKKETQEVANALSTGGFSALALHGDLDQKDRDKTLVRFTNKSASILVATDVAARGLDIDALDLIINYHIAHDAEVHIHRIGRTGRAGSQGIACTLYEDKESHKMEKLEHFLEQNIESAPLPSLHILNEPAYSPTMVSLQIDAGKKQKIRPGDILGALTGANGIAGKDVGKIQIFDNWAFVAVSQTTAKSALEKLENGKLKGRTIRVRRIRD